VQTQIRVICTFILAIVDKYSVVSNRWSLFSILQYFYVICGSFILICGDLWCSAVICGIQADRL